MPEREGKRAPGDSHPQVIHPPYGCRGVDVGYPQPIHTIRAAMYAGATLPPIAVAFYSLRLSQGENKMHDTS